MVVALQVRSQEQRSEESVKPMQKQLWIRLVVTALSSVAHRTGLMQRWLVARRGRNRMLGCAVLAMERGGSPWKECRSVTLAEDRAENRRAGLWGRRSYRNHGSPHDGPRSWPFRKTGYGRKG